MASLPGPMFADQPGFLTISLVHTTDLHGHILPTIDYNQNPDLGGLARCATQIRRWRASNPNSLLLDIGDVYQGTEESLDTHGTVMIQMLNALHYDAWVIGNHDFDWGTGALNDAVNYSSMPVLSGNARFKSDSLDHLSKSITPYLIKEVAGFRVAIIGLTTPGLASWLPPENLNGVEVLDPLESLHRILPEVAAQKPDAIVLAGHMGLTRLDDYANRVGALTREFPQLTVYLGGHTHKNHPGELINNVLYTQADHYGIYAGKVDLTFDVATRRLLRREATTVSMNHTVDLDPLVLSVAKPVLDVADQIQHKVAGELTEPFTTIGSFGRPSDVERLIASGIRATLVKKNVEVDAIAHGLFDKTTQAAGPKSVSDLWTILPYENQIVTVELSRSDFLALAQDFAGPRDFRNLMGVQVVTDLVDSKITVTDLRAADGSPLPDKPRYRIALNSYDSQSGGERFLTVARLVALPSNARILHTTNIRDALIDFFVTRQKVSRTSLLV